MKTRTAVHPAKETAIIAGMNTQPIAHLLNIAATIAGFMLSTNAKKTNRNE